MPILVFLALIGVIAYKGKAIQNAINRATGNLVPRFLGTATQRPKWYTGGAPAPWQKSPGSGFYLTPGRSVSNVDIIKASFGGGGSQVPVVAGGGASVPSGSTGGASTTNSGGSSAGGSITGGGRIGRIAL